MPAAAATAAATSTRLKRSASVSLSASSRKRQEHGEGDHRGDVQAADRQQVGQAAAPHRVGIVLVDGILVAGDQRDGDPGRVCAAAALRYASSGSRARGRGPRARPVAITVTGPSALPTAPMPLNQASRAKS